MPENKSIVHYSFRIPHFDENGECTHYTIPESTTNPDLNDCFFDLLFSTPEQATSFLDNARLLEEAQESHWLLMRIEETPVGKY